MDKKFDIPKQQIEEYIYQGLTYKEMAELIGCSHWTVMKNARSYGLRSNARQLQQLSNNVAKDSKVQKKISDNVKLSWAEGCYKERINGMIGVSGINHPNFKTENHFREKALFYHGEKCIICGCEDKKINIHHVDEDHKNILLSNLEPLCVHCHQKYHYKFYKQPYCTIVKTVEFDSAHFLPNHPKKCKFLHGHSYKLEIAIRHRVHPETGMVMDFGKLKEIVNKNIIQVLDHAYINNYLEMPTSENIIIWIWEQLSLDIKGLQRLRLYETGSSYSEITAKDMLDFVNSYKFEANWLNDEELINNKKEKDEAIKYLCEE